MERVLSMEERIRRAEEIYARRHEGEERRTAKVQINSSKKDIKLLKKMIIQMLVSLFIYLIIYTIYNGNYIFSKDFLDKADEILSYEINFSEIYEKAKGFVNNSSNGIFDFYREKGIDENDLDSSVDNNIENNIDIIENSSAIGGAEEGDFDSETGSVVENKTQEEQDIEQIKNTTTFIKPIQGVISSRFGQREPTTIGVPKNHTGVDIAADLGTKIIASTPGEVVLASEEGDYGKHLKVLIGEVSVIYAHCNNLYVKEGDKIAQGQEIAEVGSTGNSTGPHLHFEIRYSERVVDPEKVLEL